MSAGHDPNSGTQVPMRDGERIGWAAGTRVTSGGYASTLPLSDERKAELEQTPPTTIGFAPTKGDR